MKVDIIIPAYNPGSYLKDALDSCLAQTYKNYQIYVIDDCSTENIKSVTNDYPNICYIRTPHHLGPGGTRNYGIANGSGELLSFLDADDMWEPKKLEWSVTEFEKDKSIAMTCGNYRRLEDRKRLCNPFYRHPPIITWQNLMRVNLVACGSVTLLRSIFEKIGGFSEKIWICEDYNLWLKVSEQYKIKYVDQVLYLYSVIKDGKSLTNQQSLQIAHKGVGDIIRRESMERVNALKQLEAKSNNFNKNIFT